jgi:hypothetical protein
LISELWLSKGNLEFAFVVIWPICDAKRTFRLSAFCFNVFIRWKTSLASDARSKKNSIAYLEIHSAYVRRPALRTEGISVITTGSCLFWTCSMTELSSRETIVRAGNILLNFWALNLLNFLFIFWFKFKNIYHSFDS